MSEINTQFLTYSLFAILLDFLLATIFTSLRFTGDAGIYRLIEREGKNTKYLKRWEGQWDFLCKTTRLLLIQTTIATFIFFYLAVSETALSFILMSLFLWSLSYMLLARIIPHILSESYADRISMASLPLVSILTLGLYIFVWPLQRLEDRLLQHALSTSDEEDRPSTEDEIKSLIDETDTEELEEEEREIIRSVFEFGESVAREIMTPRIDINGIKNTLTVTECIDLVKESRHSRFPVYHENIDDVIGMVHVKDLLKLGTGNKGQTAIGQLTKKIEYIPETMPLNNLLQLMKKSHTQMVLVVDEYGGTEGLVTMEDVIEELVGEIEDEYDLIEKEFQRRPDGSIMVQARMPIEEINEELGTKLPESDEYDSLGGYISAVLGRIPRPSETLEVAGYTLRIHSATQRQIQVVQLLPTPLNEG